MTIPYSDELTSFAINIAAGIALNLYDSYTNNIDKQIKSAYQGALKDWSINKFTKDKKEEDFKNILKDYINNSDGTIKKDMSNEIIVFFNHFEKRIAKKKLLIII